MRHVLVWHHVTKRYGRRTVLQGFSLKIRAGAIVGLVGSNGAGKTTAMAVAAGTVRCDEGYVELFGECGMDPMRFSGRLAWLPQDSELPRDARVRELLIFYAMLQGLPKRTAAMEADRCLDLVHLSERADAPTRTLSHGMRKRLMISQCFLGCPEVVLLDEPLNGLDPREAARVRQFLAQQRGRRTMVISSHNLFELEFLCDEVAFIEQGRVREHGPMDRVIGREDLWVYELAPNTTASWEELQSVAEGLGVNWQPERAELTVRFRADGQSADDVNAAVLRWLLDRGLKIRAVHRGQRLEERYMAATHPN